MVSYNRALLALLLLGIAGCGSGSRDSEPGSAAAPENCTGGCVESQRNGDPDNVRLTQTDVQTIIAQAVAEADAIGEEATIAVVDRVGNVLAVWRTGTTPGTPRDVLIASQLDGNGGSTINSGLDGLEAPIDSLAAIAKAVTGAYLSSEGNAFTTRTANQIVQEHFNPGELFQPGGPLFGVQFSQFACSDFTQESNLIGPTIGPQRSPLGLSADPGGFPLYKNGTVVGGVGVIADDIYGLDKNITDEANIANNVDERIALAASFNYAAPLERRAHRITVEGKTLRFSDAQVADLLTNPNNAPAFPPANGQLIAVNGYNTAVINTGLVFGDAASGIRAADAGNPAEAGFAAQDAFLFVDNADNNRFPPSNGLAPVVDALQANEVATIMEEALKIANRSRAQIRRPHNSQARVTISVVDAEGNVVGMARTRDAPVFGADVSLQKARTATFFSSADAATTLNTPGIEAQYITLEGGLSSVETIDLADYVTDVQNFLGNPDALTDGAVAFSDRAGGNLSRPFFPDGIDNANNGPFSKPPGEWSPFSTGLQLDLSINGVVQHVLFAAGAIPGDVPNGCAGITHDGSGTFGTAFANNRLANGLQIFPGSVPIYRDDVLVGGIGISGDGVEQDDMIAFLAVHQAAQQLGGAINNAPPAMRADQLSPQGVRLRYIQCPQAPFLDSDEQQPCEGL